MATTTNGTKEIARPAEDIPGRFRSIRWIRDWGGIFDFLWNAEEGRAYCLADNGHGLTFYVSPCQRDPVTAERFNVLPWFPDTKDEFALDAWRTAVARAGAGS